jgi:hypothetical protein
MQGIESLNNFKSFVSTLGGLGRFEDTYMVHAAEGETVVPMEVLNSNPLLKERLFESMRDMGIQPERYVVGNKFNSINPVTGQPEFFLKKIVSQIRKAMPGDSEKYLGAAVGALTGNPFYGALAGGVGSGTSGALTGGAAGAMLPGFSRLGGQAPNLVGYLKGMAPNKLFSKAGSYLVNPMGRAQDFIGGIMDKPFNLPSKMIEGVGSLGELAASGFTKGSELLSKLTGGDQMSKDEIIKLVQDGDITPEVGEFLLKNAGGNNKLLLSLLGLGGTLGLGSLIGEPEDITVDESKMRVAPIETGQVFNPNQSVTVDTGYNVPITPYQAAEGGIIGYREGGFTGSPHGEGPMYTGEDAGQPFPEGLRDELMKYLFEKFMQEEEFKRRMEEEDRRNHYKPIDPNEPIEVADGGIIDFFKSMFGSSKENPKAGKGTVGILQRKKFEMLNSLKESGLDYDEQEYLKLKELLGKANGGVMDLRKGGASNGPGTGTSDSIPAMLSDGEFVMTAKAVRGAGGGDRREGARKMYEAMDKLEAQA